MARLCVGKSLSRLTARLSSTGSVPARLMFNVAHQNPDPSAEFEQVTPLVFLPDFVQSTDAVANCTATLAATARSSNDHGYSTIFVTRDGSQVPSSIDEAVTQLHGILQALPMPPLVLASGTSVSVPPQYRLNTLRMSQAYFVNKYLESYPFSAALFLNPCSPDRALHVQPAATAVSSALHVHLLLFPS